MGLTRYILWARAWCSRYPAYYSSSFAEFVVADSFEIFGRLTAAHAHDLEGEQRDAWTREITILKSAVAGVDGTVYREFSVPRLGSWLDAVLLIGPAIFPIEFKCGERGFVQAHYN